MINVFMAAADLITDAGLGQMGVDMFIGTIPADVKQGIMFRESMNPSPIDDGLRGFYNVEFQIIVRDYNPRAAYNRCKAISEALRVYRFNNGTVAISWMRPVTLPVSYPMDKDGELEASCRIQAGYAEIAA